MLASWAQAPLSASLELFPLQAQPLQSGSWGSQAGLAHESERSGCWQRWLSAQTSRAILSLPHPAWPCLYLLTFPSSQKMLASLKSFVVPGTHQTFSRRVRAGSGLRGKPTLRLGCLRLWGPSSGLPISSPEVHRVSKPGCASPSQLCSPSSLLLALPQFPSPHCAKCKQESLLPAAEARTAPLGFPQQSSYNSKGGPELSASHSDSLPEPIHLLIR